MGTSNSKSLFKNQTNNKNSRNQKETIDLDSLELAENDSTINVNIRDHNTFNITDISDGTVAKVKYKTQNGIRECTIYDCNIISTIFKILISSRLEESLLNSDILFVKFIMNKEILLDQNLHELGEIALKYGSRGVLIVFESQINNIGMIYWKPRYLNKFFYMNHTTGLKYNEYRNLSSFMVQFLLESIKNGFNGLHSSYFIKPEVNAIEVHLLADCDDHNLLLLAAKQGNAKIVKILLELGMSTNLPDNNINAQELALANNNFDVILELVYANLPYPLSIDMKKCYGKLMDFYEKVENLHKFVRSNAMDKIKDILNQFPEQIYFYNSSNESVLKVAILSSSIAAYEYLLSRKMKFGPHEDPEELYQHLNDLDKRIIREVHNKFTQHSPKKHLNILIANSFICHDEIDVEQKIKHVQNAYKALNTNILVRIILMIVAASKNFKIIFDFNRESVSVADPTVDSYTQGLFYPMGRIYIGAKQLLNEVTENETLGNLAHELCHFAMNLVYRNNANPYTSNDNQTMQEFEKIYEECKKNAESEDIISMVYDLYQSDMQHAELIVRVVHILMYYRNNQKKLDENRKNFRPLFEFYEKKIFPELENALPEIESRLDKEIQKHIKKASKFKKISFIGIGLCIILLVMATTIGFLLYSPHYKFSELSASQKLKIQNSFVDYKNVIVKFNDLFAKNSPAYESLISDHISEMLNGNILNLRSQHMIYLNERIFLDWKNLTKKLKDKILDSDFDFQGEIVKFKDFHSRNFTVLESLSSLQMNEILDGKKLKIGEMIKSSIQFFVERKFIQTEGDFPLLNFTDAIKMSFKQGSFILCADVGNGKTTTFKEFAIRIKKMDPMRWIAFVNLKNTAKVLMKNYQDIELMLLELLELNLVTKFEKKLFLKLFRSGEVVFLWNGFDAVNVENIEILSKILRRINHFTFNIQFVSSRSIYSGKLTEIFHQHPYVFKMAPLDEKDQKDFLVKIISAKGINDTEKINEYASKVLATIQRTDSRNGKVNSFDDLRIPFVLEMITELALNNVKEIENIYFVFEKFIAKKIEIWTKKFEIIPRFSLSFEDRNFDVIQIFHKYALINELSSYTKNSKEIYSKLKVMSLNVSSHMSNDELSQQGILYLTDENEFRFVHRTFGEFFVAHYLIEAIYKANDMSHEEAELRLRLFYEITRRYGRHQVIITDFISSFLQIQNMNQNDQFDRSISHLLHTKFNKILFPFLELKNVKILEFLFQFFSKDQKLFKNLLRIDSNESLYEASFTVDWYNSSDSIVFQNEIKNLAQKFLKTNDFLKFTNVTNPFIVLNPYFYNLSTLQNTLKGATTDELEKIFFFEKSPIYQERVFVEKDFWDSVKNHFPENESIVRIIKNIFITYTKIEFDDILLDNLSQLVFENIEKFMTDSEIFEMFIRERFFQKTTSSISVHEILWNFLMKHSNKTQQDEMLRINEYEVCSTDINDFVFGTDDCFMPIISNFTTRFDLYSNIASWYFK